MGRSTGFLALLICCLSVSESAARYEFGTKPVQLSQEYGTGMNELVNDPARTDAHAMLAHSEFTFAGEPKELNKLIAKYAALDGSHIYLTVGSNNGPLSLQLRQFPDKGHSLTVHFDERFTPTQLELPNNVFVEAFPTPSESLDPKRKAAESKLWEEAQAIVKAHQEQLQKSPSKSQLPNGDDGSRPCIRN